MFESQRLRFPPTSSTNNNQQQASSSNNNKPPPLIRPSSFQRLGTPTITLPTNSVSFPSSSSSSNGFGLRLLPKPSSSSTNPSPTNAIGSSMGGSSAPPGLMMNRPNRSLSKPNLVFPTNSSLSSSLNNNNNNNNTNNNNEFGFGNQSMLSTTTTNNFLDIPSNNNQIGSLSSSPQSFGSLSSSPVNIINNNNNTTSFSVYSSPSTSCSPSSLMIPSNNNQKQGFPSSVSPSNSFQSPITSNNNMNVNNNQSGIIQSDSTQQQANSSSERVIVDFEEFEAAKENIIPLKGGRKATDLRRIFGKQPLQEIKPLQPIMLPGSATAPTSLQSPPTLCTSFNGGSSTSFNPLMSSSNNVNACSTPMSPTGMFSPTSCMNSSFNGFNTIVALSAPGEDDCAMTDASPLPQQGKPHFNFSNLTKSKVCFDNHNMKPKLSVERKQFEKRIASLSNHLDPITVWLEYIEWIEKSYPTLSKASQYVPTLQACTKFILSNQQLLERYGNDERYLGVWLKYADQCLDPIDVFTFLESKKICLNHSELYIRWATLLEDRKDLKAADAVLEQGINRGAQPAKSLQTFHTGVKARFMKSILNRTASTGSNIQTAPPMIGGHNSATQPGDSNNQRLPFNNLGKKPTSNRPTNAIPSGPLRSGPPIPSMKPTKMKNSNASLSQKNSPINNFVIYDESTGSAEKIAHAATTRTLPFQIPKELTSIGPRFLASEQELEKENNEKPDKWSNYSLPQQNDDMMLGMLQPIGASISKPACHFAIFVDEEFK